MKITVKAIFQKPYTSEKGVQYVRGVDLETGGTFQLTSTDVDFKPIAQVPVLMEADAETNMMTFKGNSKPSLVLNITQAQIKKV